MKLSTFRLVPVFLLSGLIAGSSFAATGGSPFSPTPVAAGNATAPFDLELQPHIDNGKLRFAQNCAYCHGAEGVGGKHRKLQCRSFEPDYLFDTITFGLESGSFFMPPWEDAFSEEKRWELVAFILSLGALETCG